MRYSPLKRSPLQVGSDWHTCPFCASDTLAEPHHPACPLIGPFARALCHWCGTRRGLRPHSRGCPAVVHLFPVTISEVDALSSCGVCADPFLLGDCFVLTGVGRTCLGCAWMEAAS